MNHSLFDELIKCDTAITAIFCTIFAYMFAFLCIYLLCCICLNLLDLRHFIGNLITPPNEERRGGVDEATV